MTFRRSGYRVGRIDLRQLLWHRHRMVQARTRIMNQLQAVALNEGVRCKKRLWREAGREQLESFRLAPWASRRRHDLRTLRSQPYNQEPWSPPQRPPRGGSLLQGSGHAQRTSLACGLVLDDRPTATDQSNSPPSTGDR